MTTHAPAVRPRPPSPTRARLLLITFCAVQFIDAFDVSSMGPALPEIQRELGMAPDRLQWVVTAYVLGYGGFLLLGGRLADLFNRKSLLIASLVLFVLASTVGGLATSGDVLIGARLVKGIAAAFSAPAALALLLSSYEDEGRRNKALGTFIALSAVGFTAGLILGGVLAAGSWRLVLFVPAALALVLIVLAARVIPPQSSTATEREAVDVLGAFLVTTGLIALVYGVNRATSSGWGEGVTLGVLAGAVLALAGFVQIQRVHRAPLVPLGIFSRPGVTRGNLAIFLLQGGYVAWQFLATLYLQNVQGWSPIEVGLVFAPGGLLVILTASRWAGRVATHGPWPIASAGMALMVLGFGATLFLGTANSLLVFLVASTVIGFGYAMCFPAANISAVAAARPTEQGLASGLFIASFQIGSGIVLAVVASVLGSSAQAALSSYRAGLLTAGAAGILALLVCLSGLARRHTPPTPGPSRTRPRGPPRFPPPQGAEPTVTTTTTTTTRTTVTVHKDVMVPMRDGRRLATDLWIPRSSPAPTLLVRTPYGKDVPNLLGNALNTSALVEAGYAVVYQDTRGTYRSEGRFTPMADDPHDGADTVDWLRHQPWCDGTIGTFGASYLGFVQWATAAQQPAGLAAIAPTVTTADYYTAPWYSEGGALSLHMALWWSTLLGLLDAQRSLAAGTEGPQPLVALAGALGDLTSRLEITPTLDQPALDVHAPWFAQWLAHPDRDRFWRELSVLDRAERVTVPALHVGGWFDIFAGATARAFTRMRQAAGTESARAGQRLIVGPWDHLTYTGVYHDRQFGMAADVLGVDLTAAHVAFFDRWLRGRTDALDGSAPVRIFVMGADEWRDEQDWPLPDTVYTDYFLGGSGRANTADGDGVLSTAAPAAEAVDTIVYDPADPVPSAGGRMIAPSALNAVGPVDQREVETREDVLCFTTPALREPVEVTGHVSLVLHVSSSAVDTDLTGKLVDVFPDGRALYLTDGILRARYRDGLEHPRPLEPGTVYELTLDLSVTANVFLPGHRIRLEVSSSNFPRYDRKTNTGGPVAQESLAQAVVATNRVRHGTAHPSRLVLPVITR